MRITGIRILCAYLCNGRRAFMGNNLYSKGACYTCAAQKRGTGSDAPVYLDETKLTEQIVRADARERRGRLVPDSYPGAITGTNQTDSSRCFLDDTEDIEIHVDSLVTGRHLEVETVSSGRSAGAGETMRFV